MWQPHAPLMKVMCGLGQLLRTSISFTPGRSSCKGQVRKQSICSTTGLRTNRLHHCMPKLANPPHPRQQYVFLTCSPCACKHTWRSLAGAR